MVSKTNRNQPRQTYHLVKKFDSDGFDCNHVTFSAVDQADADAKASRWNRYHGKAMAPGYGYQIAALAPDGTMPAYDHFFR